MDIEQVKKLEPIFGSWYVDKQLGSGSFGHVYSIYKDDAGMRFRAALKTISIPQNDNDIKELEAQGFDKEAQKRYFDDIVGGITAEIRIMHELRGQANIVCFEDTQTLVHPDGIGRDILIRMELLQRLDDYMHSIRATHYDVMRMWRDLASALVYCEKKNIIHRDIKPDNIMVSEDGDFKLVDFGIARNMEKATAASTKAGSYPYMAPEVQNKKPYGMNVDIYSLGIVAYREFNAYRYPFLPPYPQPFTADDRDNAMYRRFNGEDIPPVPGLSKDVWRIIEKSVAFRPDRRYQDARMLLDDIEQVLRSNEEKLKKVKLYDTAGSLLPPSGMSVKLDPSSLNHSSDKSVIARADKSVHGYNGGSIAQQQHVKTGKGKKIALSIAGVLIVTAAGSVIYVMKDSIFPKRAPTAGAPETAVYETAQNNLSPEQEHSFDGQVTDPAAARVIRPIILNQNASYIRGRTSAGAAVQLYINGNDAGSVFADENGMFEFSNKDLPDSAEIRITATDPNDASNQDSLYINAFSVYVHAVNRNDEVIFPLSMETEPISEPVYGIRMGGSGASGERIRIRIEKNDALLEDTTALVDENGNWQYLKEIDENADSDARFRVFAGYAYREDQPHERAVLNISAIRSESVSLTANAFVKTEDGNAVPITEDTGFINMKINAIELSGTGEAGKSAVVRVNKNGIDIPADPALISEDGSWTFTLPVSGGTSADEYKLYAGYQDGSEAEQQVVSFSLDTGIKDVQVSYEQNIYVGMEKLNIITEPGATVELMQQNVLLSSAMAELDGSADLPCSGLLEGKAEILVRDRAQNERTKEITVGPAPEATHSAIELGLFVDELALKGQADIMTEDQIIFRNESEYDVTVHIKPVNNTDNAGESSFDLAGNGGEQKSTLAELGFLAGDSVSITAVYRDGTAAETAFDPVNLHIRPMHLEEKNFGIDSERGSLIEYGKGVSVYLLDDLAGNEVTVHVSGTGIDGEPKQESGALTSANRTFPVDTKQYKRSEPINIWIECSNSEGPYTLFENFNVINGEKLPTIVLKYSVDEQEVARYNVVGVGQELVVTSEQTVSAPITVSVIKRAGSDSPVIAEKTIEEGTGPVVFKLREILTGEFVDPEKVPITITAEYADKSPAETQYDDFTIMVDCQAPVINVSKKDITTADRVISGTAGKDANVTLKVNGKQQDSKDTDENGGFIFELPELRVGDILELNAEDTCRNMAEPATLKVRKLDDIQYGCEPEIADGYIRSDTFKISVQAEAGRSVQFTLDGAPARATENAEGVWDCTVTGYSETRHKLRFGYEGTPDADWTEVSFVYDCRVAGFTLSQNPITEDTEKLTGSVESGARVVLLKNGEEISHSDANSNGKFSLKVDGLNKNDRLQLVVTDKAGNREETNEYIVQQAERKKIEATVDQNMPESNGTRFINGSCQNISLKGTAEAQKKLTLRLTTEDGDELLTDTVQVNARTEWSKELKLTGLRIPENCDGKTVTLSVTYEDGKCPEAAASIQFKFDLQCKYILDKGQYAADGSYTADDTVISGTAEPGGTVKLTRSGFSPDERKVEEDSRFEFNNLTLAKGEKVTIEFTDAAGNKNDYSFTVKENTDREEPTVTVVGNTTINGKTENIKLRITAMPGKKLVIRNQENDSGPVEQDNPNGSFDFDLPVSGHLREGKNTIVVYYPDLEYKKAEVTVTLDTVVSPFKVDNDDGINEDTTVITGTAEAGATVTARWNQKNLSVSRDGENFKISGLSELSYGQKIRIRASDPAGNVDEISVTVQKADRKKITLSTEQTVQGRIRACEKINVNGSAMPEKKVLVCLYNSRGDLVGETEAFSTDANGKWQGSVTFTGSLKDNTGYIMKAVYADGRSVNSGSEEVRFTYDTGCAPVKLDITELKDEDKKISGATEPGASVTLIINGTAKGWGTADRDGRFRFDLSGLELKDRVQIKATDAVGFSASSDSLAVTTGKKLFCVGDDGIKINNKGNDNTTLSAEVFSYYDQGFEVEFFQNEKLVKTYSVPSKSLTVSAASENDKEKYGAECLIRKYYKVTVPFAETGIEKGTYQVTLYHIDSDTQERTPVGIPSDVSYGKVKSDTVKCENQCDYKGKKVAFFAETQKTAKLNSEVVITGWCYVPVGFFGDRAKPDDLTDISVEINTFEMSKVEHADMISVEFKKSKVPQQEVKENYGYTPDYEYGEFTVRFKLDADSFSIRSGKAQQITLHFTDAEGKKYDLTKKTFRVDIN